MKSKSILPALTTIVLTATGCASCPGMPVAGYSGVQVGGGSIITGAQFPHIRANKTLAIEKDGKIDYLRGAYSRDGTCFQAANGPVYKRTDKGWEKVSLF